MRRRSETTAVETPGPRHAVSSPRPPRSRRRRRSWRQRLAITGGCLSTLGLALSSGGLAYIYGKYERLPRIELGGALYETSDPGGIENYLVVGVDSASRLDPNDPVRIGRGNDLRSDTIMILRIDPSSRQAKLLSLPRDLWVPIPGLGHSRKINAAVDLGGPKLLVRTLAQNFGIQINHYVQVDFAAFRGLVEAVHGVPIYVPHPARDQHTGLDIPKAGCVTLDPVQALAYVRSRHYEELVDGRWREDLRADLGRIDRQQDFIRRALSRAMDRATSNPGTIDQLIDVGLEGIAVDQKLTADDIFSLGNRFRSFHPQNLKTYSIDDAVTPAMYGAASILRLDDAKAEPIFALFRNPPAAAATGDIAPSSVALRVLNGTGEPGQAAAAADALVGAGFRVTGRDDSPSLGHQRTLVQYPPARAAEASTVVRWLASGARLVPVAGSSDIVVVTGADWQGVRAQPSPPASTTTSTSTSSAGSAGSAGSGSSGSGSSGSGSSGSAPAAPAPGSTSSTSNPAALSC